MKPYLFSLFILSAILSACTQKQLTDTEKNEIMQVFLKTEEAWNEGDLDNFMEGYWKSDRLVFVGSSGPTYGWESTLENYKKGYPDRETMGRLKFETLDLYKIDKNSVIMIGKFHLTRTIGDLSGHYTLVWQKIENSWVIISDHSSSERKEPA